MLINTSDSKSIDPFLKKLYLPKKDSHKGQNGKLLVIGGSQLFHAASIWAATIASHFVDFVHYASTEENNKIMLSLKKEFRNGIVIPRNQLLSYVEEDDAVLIGPGMIRTDKKMKPTEDYQLKSLKELDEIEHEGVQTYYLTKYLLKKFPDKKFVLDAGAVQMMDADWLKKLKVPAIVTPHKKEFENLFHTKIAGTHMEEAVQRAAKEHNSVVLLKAGDDYISDGAKTVVVQGGNAGLTKGGTGDVLAGLTAALYAKQEAVEAAVLASYLEKRTADELFKSTGYWYNIEDIIRQVPKTLSLLGKRTRII